MKRKIKTKILITLLLLTAFVFMISCTGEDNIVDPVNNGNNDTVPSGPAVTTLEASVTGYEEVVLNGEFDTRQLDGNISNALFLISPYSLSDQMFVFENIGEADIRPSQAMDLYPTAPGDFTGTLSGTDRCPDRNRLSGNTYYYRACLILDNGDYHYGDTKSYFIPSKVGDGPAGGIVFYDKGNYSDGWRYLEAAPMNATYSSDNFDDFGLFHWSRSAEDIPGADSPTDGYANTLDIVAHCDDCIAAHLCNDFSYGGKDDWYLPSDFELSQMQSIYHAVSSVQGCNFDFYDRITLWSSTEVDANRAGYQTFGGGSIVINKTSGIKIYVRPIRRY